MLIDFGFKLEVTLPKFRKRMNKNKPLFKVILTKSGENRVQTVRAVRNVVNVSLKEAKDAVDGVPTVLGETASEEEALDVKKEIEAGAPGAEVTIEQC